MGAEVQKRAWETQLFFIVGLLFDRLNTLPRLFTIEYITIKRFSSFDVSGFLETWKTLKTTENVEIKLSNY